jgi:hypothetical protein
VWHDYDKYYYSPLKQSEVLGAAATARIYDGWSKRFLGSKRLKSTGWAAYPYGFVLAWRACVSAVVEGSSQGRDGRIKGHIWASLLKTDGWIEGEIGCMKVRAISF